MARKTVEVETTGQAYLELLRERGIDYFFANAGTDFAPIIDAFARFAEQGKQTPQPITVPHGPVYLTLPREVLGEPHTEFSLTSPARRDRGGRLYPDPKYIEAAAAVLATAERPLIITGTSGRNLEAVGHLVALAESFAIP